MNFASKTGNSDAKNQHGRENDNAVAYFVLMIDPRHVNEREFRHAFDFARSEALLLGDISVKKWVCFDEETDKS